MDIVLPWKNTHVIFLFENGNGVCLDHPKSVLSWKSCVFENLQKQGMKQQKYLSIKGKELRYIICVVCRIVGMKLTGVSWKNKMSLS